MVELSDKQAEFTFNLRTENAELKDTEARLVVETKHGNRIYPITIMESGFCELQFIPEDLKEEGNLMLEVINKDFYSRPWQDTYLYEGKELSQVEKYYQKGLQKLKVTKLNESRKEKHINILLEHTAKRYKLDAKDVLTLKNKTSNLL